MSQGLISEETRRQYIVDFKKWLLDVAGFYPSSAGEKGKLLGDFYSGFSQEWWKITLDKLREVVVVFDSVLPTMVGSIAYLIGAYEYSRSLDKVLGGLDNINKFITAVMLPRVRQYKYMLDAGYISKEDFLEYSCCGSMTEFYRRYGADDKTRKLVASRQKREISDEQLARGMYLDDVQQVNDVLGLGWRVALNVKETLNDKGVNITYEQSQELLRAVLQDAGVLTEEQYRMLEDTADKIREMGLDKLAPKDMADICDKGFQGAIEEANAETKPAAEAAASHQAPILGANAFVDETDRRPDRSRGEETVVEPLRNIDVLHANIALEMRRMEPQEKGVASFRTDDGFQSSFQSVSFASPFQNETAFGAERRAVQAVADIATNF